MEYKKFSPFRAFYFNFEKVSPYSSLVRIENYFYFLVNRDFNKKKRIFRELVNALKDKGKLVFDDYVKRGIIVEEKEDSFYLYVQEFRLMGKKYRRKGLLLSIDIDDISHNLYPHEEVFDYAVDVHRNFYERAKLNFEPVMLIYNSSPLKEEYIKRKKFLFDFTDEFGDRHVLYRIEIKSDFFKKLSRCKFVIADGHHRFEAIKKAGLKKRLFLMLSIFDRNLKILPTHRGLTMDKERIEMIKKRGRRVKINDILKRLNSLKNPYLIFMTGNEFFYLSSDKNELSVEFLHREFLDKNDKIEFFRDFEELYRRVLKNEFNAGFFLPPVNPVCVFKYAKKGKKMPPKSTDFYPKPLCGFIGMEIW